MKTLKAEMWDKMQFLFRNYYDRTMHAVCYFDGIPDKERLCRAVCLIVGQVPVLHSTFHNAPIRPYWTINEFDTEDFFTEVETDDERIEEETCAYTCQSVMWTRKVQLSVTLIHGKTKSSVVYLVNHMCSDGGDFKYLLERITKQYNLLAEGKREIVPIKKGSRNYRTVYEKFTEEEKKIAKKLYKNISAVKDKHVFPLSANSAEDRLTLVKHKMTAERFNRLNIARKKIGATVNDCLLAAYFEALYDIGGFERTERVAIPNMVDLRRYIPDGAAHTGITNHTGFMICDVKGLGENTVETLKKVQKALESSKNDPYLGLYGLPLLNFAYTFFPQCIAEALIRLGYSNPKIGMSNVGILTDELFGLNGCTLTDAFMTGATKYKPYMQLALTTFRGVITFTIAIRGNAEDRKTAEKFFEIYDRKIEEICTYS